MRKRQKIKAIITLLLVMCLTIFSATMASAEEGLNVGDVLPDDMAEGLEGGSTAEDNAEISKDSGKHKEENTYYSEDSVNTIQDNADNFASSGDINKEGNEESGIDSAPEHSTGIGSSDTPIAPAPSDENIFEEIYGMVEDNADKILAGLAFIGTLIVGIAYKSGLMPLLRDALSKLRVAVEKVKENGEVAKESTDLNMREMKESLMDISTSLDRMKWQYDSLDTLCKEREKHQRIMLEQIDMLYAIFMASALPQYQKEEIGEKIGRMREELKIYDTEEQI